MFKPLFLLGSLFWFSSCLYADEISPEDSVKQFYAAVKAKDCKLALILRANFTQDRCEKLSSPSIKNLKTVANDQQNAVVNAQIDLLADGKPQNFDGFIHLQKQTDHWQLQEFEYANKTSASAFIQRYMQPATQKALTPAPMETAPDHVDLTNPEPLLTQLRERFPDYTQDVIALVDISAQRMGLFKGKEKIAEFPISSATKGVGSQAGSDQTPLGAHIVSEKFGDNAIKGSIFNARRDTGTPATILTDPIDVPTDYVTTRILWLDGLESGKNKGGDVDSKSRFIYIHGTPEEGLIGKPASHGCIRMKNNDVIKVYDLLKPNTLVYIGE